MMMKYTRISQSQTVSNSNGVNSNIISNLISSLSSPVSNSNGVNSNLIS